jgi:hypothetical protein
MSDPKGTHEQKAVSDPNRTHEQKKATMSDPERTHKQKKAMPTEPEKAKAKIDQAYARLVRIVQTYALKLCDDCIAIDKR